MSTSVPEVGWTPAVAPVAVAGRGLRHEVRAVGVVWQRDLLRFRTDRSRLVSSSVQPLLFLFVLGKGLGASINTGAAGNGDYATFLFPGVLATSVMLTAVFSAISIVWDREAGFLREMLVAPVSRNSIRRQVPRGRHRRDPPSRRPARPRRAGRRALPACDAARSHRPALPHRLRHHRVRHGHRGTRPADPDPHAAGAAAARAADVPVRSVLPISPALAGWLHALSLANPLTYGVDAVRRLVFHYLPAGVAPGGSSVALQWAGRAVPAWLDIAIVLGAGGLLLALACAVFSRTE